MLQKGQEHSGLSHLLVVQSLICVQHFATQWTAAHQASLSFTISQSMLKLIELVMPSNHLVLCHPLLLLPSIFPSISLFQWVGSSYQVAKVLELQLQHQSFQSIEGLFPLRLTGLISLQSKGLSRVISSTTIRNHQYFGALPSLLSSFHICHWQLERPLPWLYGTL